MAEDVAPLHSLSIVVPALNEEVNIGYTIQSLRDHGLDTDLEIIVVDGSSSDNTVKVAKGMGAKVVSSTRGRGIQLNAGFAAASGDWTLFCHADTLMPPGYGRHIKSAIASRGSGCFWGAFAGIRTDVAGMAMRAIEWCVWWRTRLFWLPYGDQAIFVESSRLRQMGGFANQPLLEDVDLVLRLKRRGRPAIVQRCLQTSGRRWVKTGVGLAFVANQLILLAWALGMDPGTLASMYYGRGWQGKSGSKPSSE